jgi:hypothetical protein
MIGMGMGFEDPFDLQPLRCNERDDLVGRTMRRAPGRRVEIETAVDAAAMRSTFFIDPMGIIRATTCYPATVGRSVDEMLRLLAALQRVDADDIVTPEGWQPGDAVLLPPEVHQDAVLASTDGGDWFHRIGRGVKRSAE